MRIYMVRHGEIESNVKKMYAGTSDESLTAEGEQQARKTSVFLESRGIQRIYTSPLRRAVETAGIISRRLKVPVVTEEELREILLGPLDGLSQQEVMDQFPEVWQIWNQAPGELRLEGMESLQDVQERILLLIKKWYLSHKDETIGAVTHLAVMRCTLLYQQGRPLNDYRRIEIPNATGFTFDIEASETGDSLDLTLVEEIRG